MKLGFLYGGHGDSENCINACRKAGIECVPIDLMSPEWIEEIKKASDCDGFLVRPGYRTQEMKSIYDERVFFVSEVLQHPIYPSYKEILLYENKRNMASWLEVYDFPRAKTRVFTEKKRAMSFIKSAKYPIVRKSNVGSAAKGVQILKTYEEAKPLVKTVFRTWDERRKLKGFLTDRLREKVNPELNSYHHSGTNNYIIFQEFIDIKWEWRIVNIGGSFFGHKKLIGENGFASGSLAVGWVDPPVELLKLVEKVCEVGGFNSMAVDILESVDGKFYINELQSIFGAYAPSQMYINEVPGKYVKNGNEFEFIEGEFCKNGCWDLRVEHFVSLLEQKNKQ